MKKKIEQTQEQHELEIIKAVAQAWHGHSTATATAAADPTAANEFDARRLNFKNKPTRFRLEAMAKPSRNTDNIDRSTSWDFRQSLWDSYEIVAVSRRLENGLLLGDDFDESTQSQVGKRKKKESKNSLRNVLNRTLSKRFDD